LDELNSFFQGIAFFFIFIRHYVDELVAHF
jgi:hypothetical protein